MIPVEEVVMVPGEKLISQRLVQKIAKTLFSRIPVYLNHNKNEVIGILSVKTLLDSEPDQGKQIINASSARVEKPIFVVEHTSLLEMLSIFQLNHTRLAIVTEAQRVSGDASKVKIKK